MEFCKNQVQIDRGRGNRHNIRQFDVFTDFFERVSNFVANAQNHNSQIRFISNEANSIREENFFSNKIFICGQ